jgi:hypothetical protein
MHDRPDLATTVLIDPDGHQYRLADDNPGIAHLSRSAHRGSGTDSSRPAAARKALRLSSSDLLIALIELAEKVWPHRGFSYRLHLAGLNALHVHLGQRPDQRLLRTLIAFGQL